MVRCRHGMEVTAVERAIAAAGDWHRGAGGVVEGRRAPRGGLRISVAGRVGHLCGGIAPTRKGYRGLFV
jgi:hypothetical protein